MNYKERLEDLQLNLKGYGEWQNKTVDKQQPKFYLKDKRTTVWTKKVPKGNSYIYQVFVNNSKKAEYDRLDDAKKSMMMNMNRIADFKELKEKFCKEMAVVSKIRDNKTPEQRHQMTQQIFRQSFSSMENSIRSKAYYFPANEVDVSISSGRATVAYGGTFEFNSMYKDNHFGYYEAKKNIEKALKDFKQKASKILRINFKSPRIETTSTYSGNITASFHVIGTAIFKQIVAYLYDKNTNKKIKLGTYQYKYDAESEAGGMYGFSTHRAWKDGEKHYIYYWSKLGRGQKILKEFDDTTEMNRYYDRLEISIEEVQK